MSLSIATWNINSVRLRIDSVLRYLTQEAPDVLCLQETKCPDAEFPRSAFTKAGYAHVVHRGMKGYNGVAIIAKRPLRETARMSFCGKEDARHIAAEIMDDAGQPITIHNLYIPAGGDIPDHEENPKFGHKLDFLTELTEWAKRSVAENKRSVVVGDLNIAPYVNDVWNHKSLLKIVSHTPIETEALCHLLAQGGWTDAIRHLKPEPERIYTWWSYRSADWSNADKGRRLDHIWVGEALKSRLERFSLLRDARGWVQPSDHVPLCLTLSD